MGKDCKKDKKILHSTHKLEIDNENSCARLYRISRFEEGPIPLYPYEGKEEILINEKETIVKKLGTGYLDFKML